MKTIRLCCVECDRRDHDGIAEIPPHWLDHGPADMVDDLLEGVTGDRVAPHWYTHLGTCPDCLRKARKEIAAQIRR